MTPIGRTRWALSAGCIPAHGHGEEPAFTPHDQLALLNAGDEVANVRVQVVYTARDPVGPFRLVVAAGHARRVRINDLIFPEAVRLDEPYGLVVESDQPVVVQFTRMDTRARANASTFALAFADWPAVGRSAHDAGGTTRP